MSLTNPPETWTYKLGNQERQVDLSRLSEEELAVLSLITFEAPKLGGRITQREIMESERWMGCHPKHEGDIGLRNPEETTLRQVRAIIRRLKIEHHIPILSDVKGYWITDSQSEWEDAMDRLEATAKAQARAWYETYRELSACFPTVSRPYFEGQARMFQTE